MYQHYLFFDTETTGIPKRYDAPISDVKNWPRIVQLAWLLTDLQGYAIHTNSLIIKPTNFIIPPDVAKVHKITQERGLKEGIEIETALNQFIAVSTNYPSLWIAHNINFDKPIMSAEFFRLQKPIPFNNQPTFCTMLETIKFCAFPNDKWPRLSELYFKLFQTPLVEAHDALKDVQTTAKCFFELLNRKIIN